MSPQKEQTEAGRVSTRFEEATTEVPSSWLPAIFEESPFGLVVTSARGVILSANRRATEMLFPSGLQSNGSSARCCDVICGELDSPDDIGATCLTRAALAASDGVAETSEGWLKTIAGAPTPARVTAAPIDSGEARVAIYLVPSRDVEWTAGSALHDRARSRLPERLLIRTLGETRVQLSGRDLGGDWLQRRPGELLKYLICSRSRLATWEQVCEALWPESAAPWNSASVRFQIHELRKRLEPAHTPHEPSQFVITRPGGYTLDRQRVWTDVEEFEERAHAGLAAFAQGEKESAIPPLEHALQLYQGDFLSEDPYAEWALEERDRLREVAGRALRVLLDLKLSAGDLNAAAEHSRRLASMEPLDLDVQREYLGLCIRRGRRSEALRRYSLIRKRMRREFGYDPDFTLADLGM
jgi:DNA-binding SARP family transcriptional activator